MFPNKYTVCIRSLVYNHRDYIEESLSGMVMQKTTFPFLILLEDDASTDGTTQFISQYLCENFRHESFQEIKYEGAITTFAQHKNNNNCYIASVRLLYNHYSIGGDRSIYNSVWRDKSKYEALCEGDDYWIDPLKLQKQVDFLDANPEYVMVYTNAKNYYQNKNIIKNGSYGFEDNSYENMLLYNPIPTPSVLYKVEKFKDYGRVINPKDKGWLLGDYPLWLWLSLQGKIKFMPDYTCVYRILEKSASHFDDYNSAKRFALNSIGIKEFYMGLYEVQDRKRIEDYNSHRLFNLAFVYGNHKDLKIFYKKLINRSLKDRVKMILGFLKSITMI